MSIYYKGPQPDPPPPDDTERHEGPARHPAADDDPFAAADAVAARIRRGTAEPQPPAVSFIGLILAFVGAAGLAGCIAMLYQGMAVIMETEGGFVATGGPYEIVHPAPDWVWIVPVSIMALFVFGGVVLYASTRGWGANIILFAWMGLFLSLGWNFIRLSLIDPPENLQGGWGWVLSGAAFMVMGLAPLFLIFGWAREGWMQIVERQTSDARLVWSVPTRKGTAGVYIAAQLIGVIAGIAVGIAMFAAVTT